MKYIIEKLNKIFEAPPILDLDADDNGADFNTLINQWKKRREVDQVRKYGKVKYAVN